MSRHRDTSSRLIRPLPQFSRSTKISIAAGTALAASITATVLTVVPSTAAKPAVTRFGMAGDLSRTARSASAQQSSAPEPSAPERSLVDETGHQLRVDETRAQAAAAAHRAEVALRAARRLAEQRREVAARQATAAERSAAPPASAPPATPSGSPQQIAMAMLSSYGWSSSEFSCLDDLWERESGWNPGAENPTSGAYGIPQALPGSKMATAGADWATNPATQIRWGLGYIKSDYGSPCGAWDHEEADGWY